MSKKRFAIFFAIFITLLSCLLIMQIADEKQKEPLRVLETECGNLKLQLKKLEREQKRLKRDHDQALTCKGTVELVFLDIDEKLAKKAFPLMRSYGLTGVLALEENENPDDEGNISWNQYRDILNNGWEKGLICKDAGHLKTWYKKVSEQLEHSQIEQPQVVLFVNGDYSGDRDDTLEEYGFQVAVNAGESGNYQEEQDEESGLWKVSAAAGAREIQQSDLEKLAETGGNLSIFVNFDKTDEKNGYIEEEFRKLLDMLIDYQKAEKIVVSTFSDNREYREEFSQNAKKEQEIMEEELQIYQEQIDELMGKISDMEKRIDETRIK